VQTHRDVRHAGSEPSEHTHASAERNESVGEITQSDITDIKSARRA